MKKKYLGTILLFVFILLGCYSKDNQKQTTTIDEPNEEILLATDENFVKILNERDNSFDYEIDCKIEGNFTNSGHKEVLVFFNGKHRRENLETKKTQLFVINEMNNILEIYNVPYTNYIVNNRSFIKEIDKFEITFNNAVITDFNRNGKLEIINFEGAGSVFQFFICEFKNGNFEHICQTYNPELNIPGLYNYILEHFDFEEKSMYLRNLNDNEIIKLKWNPETQFYDKEILSEMHTQLESKLTDSDLTNLSKGVLRLMRNAIYARHGRIFNSYDLQYYFDNSPWYKPNPNYSDDLLTDIDKHNIELIQKYEAKQ